MEYQGSNSETTMKAVLKETYPNKFKKIKKLIKKDK